MVSALRSVLKHKVSDMSVRLSRRPKVSGLRSHPDMTFAVDWALNNNYLSIWPQELELHANKIFNCLQFEFD